MREKRLPSVGGLVRITCREGEGAPVGSVTSHRQEASVKRVSSRIAVGAFVLACVAVAADAVSVLCTRAAIGDFEAYVACVRRGRVGEVVFLMMAALAAGVGVCALVQSGRGRAGKGSAVLACLAVAGPVLARPIVSRLFGAG